MAEDDEDCDWDGLGAFMEAWRKAHPPPKVTSSGYVPATRLAAVQAKLDEAVSLLKALEWRPISGDVDYDFCVQCQNFRYDGHEPDCALNLFLWSLL